MKPQILAAIYQAKVLKNGKEKIDIPDDCPALTDGSESEDSEVGIPIRRVRSFRRAIGSCSVCEKIQREGDFERNCRCRIPISESLLDEI